LRVCCVLVCVCVRACVRACASVRACVCVCMCVYLCVRVHICVSMCGCFSACVCVGVRVYVCVYVCARVHERTKCAMLLGVLVFWAFARAIELQMYHHVKQTRLSTYKYVLCKALSLERKPVAIHMPICGDYTPSCGSRQT